MQVIETTAQTLQLEPVCLIIEEIRDIREKVGIWGREVWGCIRGMSPGIIVSSLPTPHPPLCHQSQIVEEVIAEI